MQNTKTVNIDLPKFRYLDDVIRVLNNIQSELKDIQQLIIKKQASITTVDKLDYLYLLSDDINDKVRMLDAVSTQLAMQFSDQHNLSIYAKVSVKLNELRTKAKSQLRDNLAFIALVSKPHLSKANNSYASSIFNLVTREIKNTQAIVSAYCILNNNNKLVTNYYLHLKSSLNNLGFIIPNLYIGLHIEGKSVCVSLNQEFEIPNKNSLTDTVKPSEVKSRIHASLHDEQFSTSLNVPDSNPFNIVSYQAAIKSVTVTAKLLTFKLADKNLLASNVVSNIYKELVALTRSTGHKVILSTNNLDLNFSFIKTSSCASINSYDLEFMRDKFNLSESKIQKITNLFI